MYRFKPGDSIWKPTFPHEAGVVLKQGFVGRNWPAYVVKRPDGKWACILEADAERAA